MHSVAVHLEQFAVFVGIASADQVSVRPEDDFRCTSVEPRIDVASGAAASANGIAACRMRELGQAGAVHLNRENLKVTIGIAA